MAPVIPNYNSNNYAINESSLSNYNEQQSIHEPRDRTSKLSEDWEIKKAKMYQNINEILMNHGNKSTPSKSPAKLTMDSNRKRVDKEEVEQPQSPLSNVLTSNSSTIEFKKYLEELKKNYMDKLTYSCPSKLPDSTGAQFKKQKTNENKLQSTENISNLVKKVDLLHNHSYKQTNESTRINNENVRRSLAFDLNSINTKPTSQKIETMSTAVNPTFSEPPELSKTQLLTRLVQIREYLKQAYSMLTSLQTSNDLSKCESQMNKVYTMIDHLKEQEKGYMDLLNSLNLIEMNATAGSLNNQKDILDLSELNESLQQKQAENEDRNNEKQQAVLSLYKSNYKQTSAKRLSNETNPTSEEQTISPDNSLNGSYISDTVTLNGAKMNEIVKYKLKNNNTSNNKLLAANSSNTNFDDLIVVGKNLLGKKSVVNDEDERTEDDQDLNGYDKEDDVDNDELNVKECREDILKELNEDLNTLEQLREQKRLLRSIRLRKEELKALEGRRIALEALKKLALDSEKQFDQAMLNDEEEDQVDDGLIDSQADSKNTIRFEKQRESSETSNKDDLEDFLNMLKQKQIERRNKEKQNSPSSKLENASLERKTPMPKHIKELKPADSHIEPLTQIEKSKQNIKHFEQLIQNDKSSFDFNSLPKENNLFKDELYNKMRLNSKAVQTGESSTHEPQSDSEDETKEQLTNLAHNKMKLEKLYEMQSRLAHLKQVISSFGNENTSNKEQQADDESSLLKNFKRKLEENEQLRGQKLIMEEEDDDDDEKNEVLNENQEKLENARSKLVDLQDLIKRLQSFWILNGENLSKEDNLAKEKEKNEKEIKQLIIKDEEENEQIKQQKSKLEELKRNKEKLLEILKEKESESARLNKLYVLTNADTDQTNQTKFKVQTSQHTSPIKSFSSTGNASKQEEIVYLNDVDIEDDEDNEDISTAQTDTLWAQMKKQLSMRENLRSKKKELEDMIRNAYSLNLDCESNYEECENENQEKNNEEEEEEEECEIEEEEDEEKRLQTYVTNEDDSNEIINGYREFFLRKRQSTTSANTRHALKQENLCSTDELLEGQVNVKETMQQQEQDDERVYDGEIIGFDCDMFKEKLLPSSHSQSKTHWSSDTQTQAESSLHFTSLAKQLNTMFESQQKLNESMQKSLDELLSRQKSQETSFHYQTQMQIQQLMFNLNSAYHEISTQRSEMNKLQDQLKSVNERLNQVESSCKQRDEKSTNTEQAQIGSESASHKISALPSYFYSNEKKGKNTNANFKFETYYTDDFEEDDEAQQQSKSKQQRKPSTSSSSSKSTASSSTSSPTSSSPSNNHMSTSSSVCAIKNQSDCSSSHMFRGKWNISESSRTFELMREKIYSEVATLISQNETRPYYLLNLFKELQYLRDKNARDQVLKSIFNISNRQHSKCSRKGNDARFDDENEEESESENTTVICVRNSPRSQNFAAKRQQSTKSSTNSVSKVYVNDTIRSEVNGLISKIIKSIKYSDDDNDLIYVRFNRFYLNDMVDKVLNALKQSNQYENYLQKYERQLCSYLKDALKKYENRPLMSYIEDILIDISDILNNELTFYSIISSNRLRSSRSSFATDATSTNDVTRSNSLQQFEQEQREMRDRASNDSSCSSSRSEKIFYFDELSDSNAEETIDLLKRFKLIFTENRNAQDKLNASKQVETESRTTKSSRNESLKAKEREKQESVSYSYSTDEEESAESDELQQTILNKHEFERELFDKLKKQNETKCESQIQNDPMSQNQIEASSTGNVDLDVVETKSTSYSLLDTIIMNSIPDVLVGDANAIDICMESRQLEHIENANSFNNQLIDEQETGSQKSDSSNSDHYVIVKESQVREECKLQSDDCLVSSELSQNTTEVNNVNNQEES